MRLPSVQVDLWFVRLTGDDQAREAARHVLDPAEQARADRFHFDRDRDQYVFSHQALRLILGRQLGTDPASLRFRAGPRGKPALVHPATPPCRFNLSHAGDFALIGVTRDVAIGVDLEATSRSLDYADIVARYFSATERTHWSKSPPADRMNAFFRAWTLKEAYVKARGDGLSHDSERYSVDFSCHSSPVLLADALDPTAPARFQFVEVAAPDGFQAACALELPALSVPNVRIQTWNLADHLP